jgi:type 2 lantibiotic biosynthesis protein LanM
MNLESYLTNVVERASTIVERLDADFAQLDNPNTAQLIETRLNVWQQAVAVGVGKKFQRRLDQLDLDIHTARKALAPVRWQGNGPLPIWTDILAEALLLLTDQPDKRVPKIVFSHPMPFEELLFPFVHVARRRLSQHHASTLELLGDEAYRALEYDLFATLAESAVRCFNEEFLQFKTTMGAATNPDSKVYYEAFIEFLINGEIWSFFRKYSMLARLLSTITGLWIVSSSEFLGRLNKDWAELQQVFNQEFTKVSAIEAAISDRHNYGRTAHKVTFDSGLQIIYKPKNLGMEYEYNRLLDQLNAWGFSQPLRTFAHVLGTDYGWVEFVEPRPCETEAEVKRHFYRSGALACLIYALNGLDLHNENVIASGESPVIIDLEMLINPETPELFNKDDHPVDEAISISVLNSGLVAGWSKIGDGQSIDIAAIGMPLTINYEISVWRHVNTDGIALLPENREYTGRKNVVYLQDEPQLPLNYLDDLSAGFLEMYALLLNRRDELLKVWLPRFSALEGRILIRNTNLYQILLTSHSLLPNAMQTGVERQFVFENLYRGLLQYESETPLLAGVQAEIDALIRHDVPMLRITPGSKHITLDETILVDALPFTGMERVEKILNGMDESDCKRQLRFLQWATHARYAQKNAPISSGAETISGSLNYPIPAEVLIERAVGIAKIIQETAVESRGSVKWMQATFVPDIGAFKFSVTPYDIYNGTLGIAFFLAALAKINGNESYRALAYSAIRSTQYELQDQYRTRILLNIAGIGGLAGFGSLVYGFTWLSQLLNDDALLVDAHRAASAIDDNALGRDHSFDIISGAAGAILGLLALHAVRPNPELLKRARLCGNHLLANMTANGAWKTLWARELTGFLHGTAGIAYALLKLYEAVGDARYYETAQRAIAYEDGLFSPTYHNWPDLRPSIDHGLYSPSAICQGAAGIGVARAAGLSVLDTPQIRTDIAEALVNIQQNGMIEVDHVCCGNMALVESLLVASKYLNDPGLIEVAHQRAAAVLARAEQKTQYQLMMPLPGNMETLDFFHGTSGIGYQLLRLACPNDLPSLPFMEPPTSSVLR